MSMQEELSVIGVHNLRSVTAVVLLLFKFWGITNLYLSFNHKALEAVKNSIQILSGLEWNGRNIIAR